MNRELNRLKFLSQIESIQKSRWLSRTCLLHAMRYYLAVLGTYQVVATGRATWRHGRPARPRGAWGEVWPDRAGALRPVIGRWCPAPRAPARWPGDGAPCAVFSLVVCLVWCGEEQYISGWSQVVWGEVTEVTWAEVSERKVTWLLSELSSISQGGQHESILESW